MLLIVKSGEFQEGPYMVCDCEARRIQEGALWLLTVGREKFQEGTYTVLICHRQCQ